MTTLHTFGCSITQGFALPDVVQTFYHESGRPLTLDEIHERNIYWTDIHLYQPSQYAWPQVLANKLGYTVENHARRGSCFQQIARQCAAARSTIKPQDTVIVMWTYLSRISLQWPARTAVPLCNVVRPDSGWRTLVLGFNKMLGLSPDRDSNQFVDAQIQQYIQTATTHTYLDPMGIYDRYHNSLLLQVITDGFLKSTGARVIHLSVETENYLAQLEEARAQLIPALREPYIIPNPQSWYTLDIDHHSCRVIHDPRIPPAENDMHPSVTHHDNFAQHIYSEYFS